MNNFSTKMVKTEDSGKTMQHREHLGGKRPWQVEAIQSMHLKPGDRRRSGIRGGTRPAEEGHRSQSLGQWEATEGFSAGVT